MKRYRDDLFQIVQYFFAVICHNVIAPKMPHQTHQQVERQVGEIRIEFHFQKL